MTTYSRLRCLVAVRTLAGVLTLVMLATLLPLDNRALCQPPVQVGSASVLRAYPCPAADVEGVAARLRGEFRAVPNVRIAADVRTGQIVVDAPAEVQAGIAQRLASQSPPASPVARSPQTTVPAPRPRPTVQQQQPPKARTVPFWHASARDIESALVGMLANRLQPIPSAASGERIYRMSLPGGGGLDLTIGYGNNQVIVQGPGQAVDACARLIQALDTSPKARGQATRLVSMEATNPVSIQRAMDAVRMATASRRSNGSLMSMLFQPAGEAPAAEPPPAPTAPQSAPTAVPGETPPGTGGDAAAAPPAGDTATTRRALIGPVQIEMIEGLGVVIVRGLPQDVEQVMAFLQQIDEISTETEPAIEIYHLQYVDSEALTALITPLYEAVFSPRQGPVSITALVKPNSLLLIGRKENVDTAKDLVKRLDRPVPPESEFRVFRLRHAAAATAQAMVTEFFASRAGLGTKVLVTADFRSNALVVRAGRRDMAELAALIVRIDTPTSAAVSELRVFKLDNSLATDLQPILQAAITGQAGAGQQATAEQRSTMLTFMAVDPKGGRRLKSGILTDVRITADARANALLVSASTESMELIGALIDELDRLPSVEAQIKVFTIIDGDALALVEMLQSLFGDQAATSGQPAVRTGAQEGESSLVGMRFAVDTRTNSIIATGSGGDLQVVEAILLRLDESEARRRQSIVYRLKNAPANDVALAINNFLTSERAVQQISPGMLSPFEQIEREVVVVAEAVTNSLIISATPRFFDEIKKLIVELDARPPMVMIQILIAEVALGDTDEFGVELGLQDSILFDRSLLGDIITITESVVNPGTGIAVENDVIQSATFTPGYNFNNQPLGPTGGATAPSMIVGSQGMSNFGVGRVNNELGYGGFVFAASSESVSVLIRALKDNRRLDILSRPQIMTLDNQPAYIHVGQRVPYLQSVETLPTGQRVSDYDFEDVGLALGVTPRISPDGLVVMEIDATKSKLGPESEGIAVNISVTGEVIRIPRIDRALAQTTVSVLDGQTIVLGGMITTEKTSVSRKVPGLGDFPLVGDLFRYDAKIEKRAELLIIMTPHIVKDEKDADRVKMAEAARMHWCLADVVKMHGDGGLRCRTDEWSDAEMPVVYPDMDPSGATIPTPTEAPTGPDAPESPAAGGENGGPSPFRLEFPPAPQGAAGQPTPVPPPAPAGPRPVQPPVVPIQRTGRLSTAEPPAARPCRHAAGSARPGGAVDLPGRSGRPGASVFGTAVPGTAVPGTTAPGTTVPGTTVPGTTGPGATAPNATVSNATVPNAPISSTAIPGTAAPRTGRSRTAVSAAILHAGAACDGSAGALSAKRPGRAPGADGSIVWADERKPHVPCPSFRISRIARRLAGPFDRLRAAELPRFARVALGLGREAGNTTRDRRGVEGRGVDDPEPAAHARFRRTVDVLQRSQHLAGEGRGIAGRLRVR